MNAIVSEVLPMVQNRVQSFVRLYDPDAETIQVIPRPDVFQTRISHADGRLYRGMMLHTNARCVYCGCDVTACNEAKDDRTLAEWAEAVREILQRLQSLSANLEGLLESGMGVYEATKPRGIHPPRNPVPVTERYGPQQKKAKQSKLETLSDSNDRFRTGRRFFNLVEIATQRCLIRGMRPTDLAHYLAEVGFDNCGPIQLVAEQFWHPECGGPGRSYCEEFEADFVKSATEIDPTEENNRVENCTVL
jgi:hypothetical protein